MFDFKATWCMYYAGLVSIKMHPRNEHQHVDLEKLALIADEMLAITYRKFKEGPPWRGSEQ